MKNLEHLIEKEIEKVSLYDGVILNLRNDKVLLPNGVVTDREYIDHVNAVCILALTEDNEVVIE